MLATGQSLVWLFTEGTFCISLCLCDFAVLLSNNDINNLNCFHLRTCQ